MFAQALDTAIKEHVRAVLVRGELPGDVDVVKTDNLGEVVEKLIILHIRIWMLEDACAAASSDEKFGEIKRKIDTCFKQKRPAFVQAINRMVDDAVIKEKQLVEDSVKLYKD